MVNSDSDAVMLADSVDALIGAYGAGTLSAPLAALVAAYLALKPDHRAYFAALETAGGIWLNEIEPQPLANRDRRLAAILNLAPPSESAAAVPEDAILPVPLRQFLGRGFDAITWRTRLPGLKEYRAADGSEGRVSLLWIRPGRAVPVHTHIGLEVTLVLQGGFSDAFGHYRRGDIAMADETLEHRPIADPGEPCVYFAVTAGPPRLTGPIGRIVQRLFGG